MDKMYSFNEIGLLPKCISSINSRSEVCPYTKLENKLPIFVSPMTCIINDSSFETFLNSKVIPIYPRQNISRKPNPGIWEAYSLSNFKKWFVEASTRVSIKDFPYMVLIDVANGHMQYIYELVKEAKNYYNDSIIIMVGNIANPQTYVECYEAGVDYVRVGIGGGNACSTSVLTGIHVSLPWIINEIINYTKPWLISKFGDIVKLPKIVADGGIDTIDKAIKALALGADYVMMGKTFAKCEEACGDIVHLADGKRRYYYGMASTRGQQDISGGVTKASEGIITTVKVEYTLEEYINKFEASLRSCMSYTNSTTLDDFIGKVRYEIMSPSEFNSYYKYEIE